jgi:hypothetical protein
MKRMIAIIDLRSGEMQERPSDTLTIDVPADFDRPAGVVSLDAHSHGHYIATDGKSREYQAFARPLSWRIRGEECLVVDRSQRSSSPRLYRLVAIDPKNL